MTQTVDTIAPQSAIEGESSARESLERQYASRFQEWLDLRRLVTYVPNKKTPVHRWFQYKEGFSHSLVQLLLGEFRATPEKHRLLDPFLGCGTTLLVGQQMGFGGWGIDILPVAIFVSRVKLRQAHEYDLHKLRQMIDRLGAVPLGEPNLTAPSDVRIIRHAYDIDTLRDVLFFQEMIQRVEDTPIREFLLLGLMAILERVSYTSKDGQYLRLKREKQVPPVRPTLIAQLEMMLADLKDRPHQLTLPGFSPGPNPAGAADNLYVSTADARSFSGAFDDYADIVVTSPPYLNRYDYSRIYSLELCLQFVDCFQQLKEIRHNLLRSHIESREAPTDDVRHPALMEVLRNLSGERLNNPRIPVMIKGYFEDMNRALRQIARVCRPGARVALVVANARFHGELIPVDLLLSELAVDAGFEVERIIITRYKGNSSQQMGRFGRVPVRESIAVWRLNDHTGERA